MAKSGKPSFLQRVAAAWRGTSPTAKHLTAGAVGGGVLVILAGRIGRAVAGEPEGAAPKPAPPPPAPGGSTAHVGATLTVRTRRVWPPGSKQAQPGQLRSAAGKAAPSLGLVPDGTVVSVTGEAVMVGKERWYPVDAGALGKGFMHGDILA